MHIEFTASQQRIIARAITGVAITVLVLLVFFVARGILEFLIAFSGVFMPLATAFILSILLRPIYQALEKQSWCPPPLAITLILLLLALPVIILVGFFGGLIFTQSAELIAGMPDAWDRVLAWMKENTPAIEQLLERFGGPEKVQAWLQARSSAVFGVAADGVQGLLSAVGSLAGLFAWFIVPVYLVFLLMAPQLPMNQFEEFMPFLKKEQRKDIVFLVTQFVDIVVIFFRGQLIIAFAQGVMMAIGFSLSGLSYGFVLGLLMGMLNLIPYLGNMVGLAVTIPLAWFQPDGGWAVLIGVLISIGVTQAVEGYVLTPRIMGQSTGLHPMAVIFAIFFWGSALGGIFGMILAIPLTAFLVVFWRLLKEKYLPKDEPLPELTP